MTRMVAVLVMLAIGAPTFAQTPSRAFGKQDYARYFAAGRLESYSPFYESHGVLDIVESQPVQFGGVYVVQQKARSLDVSPNYDVWSDYPFYKIRAESEEQLVWNEQLDAMLYEYEGEEFDADDSVAWESPNNWAEISAGDKEAGLLHDFYRRADQRAGRDPDAFKAQYRKDVTGPWSMKCYYLVRQEYEVECHHKHQPTGRVERHMYRRLGLTS